MDFSKTTRTGQIVLDFLLTLYILETIFGSKRIFENYISGALHTQSEFVRSTDFPFNHNLISYREMPTASISHKGSKIENSSLTRKLKVNRIARTINALLVDVGKLPNVKCNSWPILLG